MAVIEYKQGHDWNTGQGIYRISQELEYRHGQNQNSEKRVASQLELKLVQNLLGINSLEAVKILKMVFFNSVHKISYIIVKLIA